MIQDNTSSSNPANEPQNFDPESSSDYTPPSYDIAPEDEELAQQIASFDPVYDVPGPVSGDVSALMRRIGVKGAADLSLDSLNPELRENAKAHMSANPGITEQAAIMDMLYDNAFATNVLSGIGESGNAYQREVFNLRRETFEAENELFQIELQFMKALRWDNEVNERTGASKPVKVDTMPAALREKLSARRDELKYRLELANGFEGDRRLKKALLDAVEAKKRQDRALKIEAAAERRAEEIVEAEEIEERAKAYAKFRRTER